MKAYFYNEDGSKLIMQGDYDHIPNKDDSIDIPIGEGTAIKYRIIKRFFNYNKKTKLNSISLYIVQYFQYVNFINMPAESKAQQMAAAIALHSPSKSKNPEMRKMGTKKLREYAKTKRKNLPYKKKSMSK